MTLGATEAVAAELFGMAGKLPQDLLGRVDARTISVLRSLEIEPGPRPWRCAGT